ncbi:MAG: type IV pili twitching motility protein PilT, partial [bacterium]|nr:type IV pili twitching motility protein PilT [bacterium]
MSNAHADPACPDQIRSWLAAAVEAGASDLHTVVNYPPVLRVHGELTELDEPPLDGETARGLLTALCPPQAMDGFKVDKNVDFSLELPLSGRMHRFRVNYFLNAQQMGACFRVIPGEIPAFGWAGFPEPLARRLADYRNGLVLISGVAGSGKTT